MQFSCQTLRQNAFFHLHCGERNLKSEVSAAFLGGSGRVRRTQLCFCGDTAAESTAHVRPKFRVAPITTVRTTDLVVLLSFKVLMLICPPQVIEME